MRILVVGAGFSGAVAARELAESGIRSLVIDSREHLAGNCHTERDPENGVMLHQYGPHIFHTSNTQVWNYVNRFAEFRPFINRVKASIDQGIFSLPINLHTINQFFKARMSPAEARAFIESTSDQSILEPENFEEQALKFIGPELYHAFFRGYTIKQWGCDPRELPASILKRLPLRFSYNDNYYESIYQGIPAEGYTALVERILDHELIEVKLSTPFEHSMKGEFGHIIYTGSLDRYFASSAGDLSYRTVYWERLSEAGDHQGNPLINYPSLEVPFTRVIEHKHFTPWENHSHTTVSIEYSKETTADDVPYYPKRLDWDKQLLKEYVEMARQEGNVSFLGRLATYRYMDMHQVIAEAINFSKDWLAARAEGRPLPVFPSEMAS